MDEWVWSNGGMVLTGENWSTGRKILYNVGNRSINEYGAMVEWYWQGKLKCWEKNIYSVGGSWMNEYGAMLEWYWQGKTEVLGEKHYTAWVVDGWMSMEQWWNEDHIIMQNSYEKTPVPLPLCLPQRLHRQDWHWIWASMTRDRLLTSDIARSCIVLYIKINVIPFPKLRCLSSYFTLCYLHN